MNREEFIKKMKEISPSRKPFEERTPEEQEVAYDSTFDWDDDEAPPPNKPHNQPNYTTKKAPKWVLFLFSTRTW